MLQSHAVLAAAVALAVSVPTVAPAFAWGALAIDSNHGSRWGYSYGYTSESAAIRRAVGECGHGCRAVVTFNGACAAYAVDRTAGSTVYGWARASSRSAAEGAALGYCRSHGGRNCAIRVWGCDNR
jgi:hypothetical protein